MFEDPSAVTSDAQPEKKSIRFRARSFVAFALEPEAPLEAWFEGLERWTENSPGFFAGRPVVLDLGLLRPSPGETAALVAKLAERGIRVYAIEGEGIEAPGPELPPLLKGAREAAAVEVTRAEPSSDAEPAVEAMPAPAPGSMIIRAPIRSGQSVYQPHGDVIVLGSVGSGSEIVAAGSVHVYGTLRGRVFAGADGNAQARIFCRRNEAELLAVDGWYRTAEDMEPSSRGRAVQAFLQDGVVHVAALN